MEESVSEGISSPAVDTHTPDAPACKKKKKRRRFPRQPHWTHEFTHDCVEKVKSLFPHLRAEGGGFLPLKIGITNDFAAFLTEHPETELTLDEWSCAISCITTRQVYLQRTAVAGIPVMLWTGWTTSRSGIRMRCAECQTLAGSKGTTEAKDENHAGTVRVNRKTER